MERVTGDLCSSLSEVTEPPLPYALWWNNHEKMSLSMWLYSGYLVVQPHQPAIPSPLRSSHLCLLTMPQAHHVGPAPGPLHRLSALFPWISTHLSPSLFKKTPLMLTHFLSFFFFLAVRGFELRASHLLGRRSTLATLPACWHI
jgi:hypothetical protein